MHWSIECNERLQEAKLQAANLKKLLESGPACKKDIDDKAKLIQIKWSEFEKAHFEYHNIVNNGIRATMDLVYHEAATEHNAVMEALAQKNAKMAAEETAGKEAAAAAAVQKAAEEATAKKALEQKYAAAAAKKKAEEVIEKAAPVKETFERVKIAAKRKPEESAVKKAEEFAAKKTAEETANAKDAAEKTVEAELKKKLTEAIALTLKAPEHLDKIEKMAVPNTRVAVDISATSAEAKESDADAIETKKANEATSAAAKKKAVVEASIDAQKGKTAVDAKIPLSPASSHHNNTSLQSYREEEHDDNQEVVPVKSKPREPPPTSTSMSSSVDNNHAVQQYGDPATPMAPPGGGTVALDNTCDADDRYDYGQYGDDSMSGYDDAGGMINPNTGMPVSKSQLNNVKKRCGTLLTLGELGIKCIVRNDTDGSYGQTMEGFHACQDSAYTKKYKASGHEYNKKYREDGHLFNKSAMGGQLGYDTGKLTFSVSKFDPGGTFRQVNAATGFKQLVPRPENENMFGGRSNSEVDSLENEDLTSSDRQTNMKLGQSLVDRVTTGVNRYG